MPISRRGEGGYSRPWQVRLSDNNRVPVNRVRLQRYLSDPAAADRSGGDSRWNASPRATRGLEAADPFGGAVRVIITGPQGFERHVAFAVNEDPPEISRRVRETIETEA